MPSIFSKIISGDIPCHKIAEDELFFAFLDIRPLQMGHTLVVPKKETDYFFDMSDEEMGLIIPFSKRIAEAIKKTYGCKRVGISVVGLEVPHAHVHLIPINSVSDMYIGKSALSPSQDDLAKSALAIRTNLQG
jgi:histidine triad (HIT) family protein